MERRLGQISQVVTAGSDSRIKLSWDTVYDIPLLGSLEQQLSDEHVLNEVRSKCYMYIVHVDSKCLAYMYAGGVTLNCII